MAPRRRRRTSTNELVTILWRDIPAQVTAHVDGAKGSWLLEERFQVAIDRAATVAGLTDADAYVLQWRRVSQPCAGDPRAAARSEAERLQQQYSRERVRALAENGGFDPHSSATPEPTNQRKAAADVDVVASAGKESP
jgi:hypothetical protein